VAGSHVISRWGTTVDLIGRTQLREGLAEGFQPPHTPEAKQISESTVHHTEAPNFVRDIAPIAGVGFPNLMMVNHSLPTRTGPEFITYAKANPGK
jgi:hypothetical protein